MTQTFDSSSSHIEKTIGHRAGVGKNELVNEWQAFLKGLLDRLHDYLKPAHIITFKDLTREERRWYETIVQRIQVPESACGLYLPPSVRNQMMYTNQGHQVPTEETEPKDNGALLFTQKSSHDIIVNALLAHPPCTPAIDVYDNGALLAGYVYDSLENFLESISEVVCTHMA